MDKRCFILPVIARMLVKIKCMLILALSVVIGTLLIAPGVLKADSGVHTLRELTL